MRIARCLVLLPILLSGCIVIVDLDANIDIHETLDGSGVSLPDGGFDRWDAGLHLESGGGDGSIQSDEGADGSSSGIAPFDSGTPIRPPTCTPSRPMPPFPGNGGPGTLQVVWLVRIDRNTADLASTYESWINQVTCSLTEDGFDVGGVAIAPLYGGDGTYLWADLGGGNAESISDALTYFAGQATAFPASACTTANYFALGSFNSAAVFQLIGPSSPTVWYGPLANSVPGAVLVGFIDSDARPFALDDPSCQVGGSVESRMGGASWQAPFSDLPMPQQNVQFLFMFTPEGPSITTQQLESACLAEPGFPASDAQAIVPSPLLFFKPLWEALPTSVGLSFCSALTPAGLDQTNDALQLWVQSLVDGELRLSPRRGHHLRRPRTKAARRQSGAGWIAAVGLLCLLGSAAWLWPRDQAAPEPGSSITPPAPASSTAKPTSAPTSRPAPDLRRRARPGRAVSAGKQPTVQIREALDKQALTLQQCAAPSGTPRELLTTLRLARDGRVRRVSFAQENALPAHWSSCIRTLILGWRVPGLRLAQPLEVFVALALDSDHAPISTRRGGDARPID